MTVLRVGIVGGAPDLDATHVPALASLPERFAVAWRADDAAGPADVILATAAADAVGSAVEAGADVLVLHRPSETTLAAASSAAIQVAVPSPLIDDPAWPTAHAWVTEVEDPRLLRMTVVIGGHDGDAADHTTAPAARQSIGDALADACALLTAVEPDLDIECVAPMGGGIEAVLGGPVHTVLTVLRVDGGPSRRRFEAIGPHAHVVADFGSPLLFGAPTTVTRHGEHGTIVAPPIDENGWRAAWRAISDARASGETLPEPAGRAMALALRITRNGT